MQKTAIILGGGTAGWLTALFIRKVWPECKVSVIEDPNTPPIVAGESGAASVNIIYSFLEIPLDEWIPYVNAMPKLGGKLTDWNGIGTEFIHGLIPDWYASDYKGKFPEFGRGNDFIACSIVENILQENIYYNGRLQRAGKLPIIKQEHNCEKFNVISQPMWHFDSRANAEFLKNIGISRGINLIEGRYETAVQDHHGNIRELQLDGHRRIAGDWFFDCSGFSRLLLHNVLQEPLIDCSNYFPARAALAWWEDTPRIVNYTDLTAMKYGWMWNINLHHRAGNGYIFDPDLITASQAQEEVERKLGRPIKPVAELTFTPALMENCWVKNVIAVGLSNGFLEPLESNGLAAIAFQLQLLSDYWAPGSEHSGTSQINFNRDFFKTMQDIRDFLALHYRGCRQDTEFWRSHREDKFRIPESLQNRLDMWDEGFIGIDNMAGYGLENYITVAQGLDLINKEKLKNRLLSKRSTILKDFNESYSKLAKEIDDIERICYTVEEWTSIVYNSPYV